MLDCLAQHSNVAQVVVLFLIAALPGKSRTLNF